MKRIITAFVLLAFSCIAAYSQDNEVTLRIGDKAPPVKYSKWIKGTPVETFKGDQLYILEFWATWCGPCKAAMPHLTKTQKQYEGKVTIIGVDVWEKVDEGKPYETALPLVTKFVQGNAANMGYSVVADNNEQQMGKNWLKAAGQNGIPSTFIVKNERIIWIGHPIKLDSTLELMMNGNYNMEEYKIAFDKKVEASMKQSAGMRAAMEPVNLALKEKDYKKAFEMMEKAKVDQPILKISMDNMKFSTLLKHISQEEAIAFGKEWQKEFKSAPMYMLSTVSGEDGLAKTTYLWAVENFLGNSSNTNLNPGMSNILAACYSKAGDFKNAVLHQEKAVEGARTALKEGKMIGTIMDYTVTEYEETLARYRKQDKATAKSE